MKRETLVNLILVILTSTVTWFLTSANFNKNYEASELGRLNDNLNQTLTISIQNPFLEDSTFTAHWLEMKNTGDERYMKYNLYCMYVFNFLENLADYYHYDRKKIEKFIGIQDWVNVHSIWWRDTKNIGGYSSEFEKLIDSYLNQS